MKKRLPVLVLACVSALTLAGFSLRDQSQDLSGDVRLGRSVDAILEELGVPDQFNSNGDSMTFTYTGKDGKEGVFAFSGECVIATPGRSFQLGKLRACPKKKVYLGQRIAAAVAILGNPVTYNMGTHGLVAEYADGMHVSFMGGRAFPSR